jgi:hypothetical protein
LEEPVTRPASIPVVPLVCFALFVFAACRPQPSPGANDDDDDEDQIVVDDGDACARGGRSRGPSESCCLAFGADACGANLFCAAFDGRTVPTCYVEHTRVDGEQCANDDHCASSSCANSGLCRASPGQPCARDVGCARFQGADYVCVRGLQDLDVCLPADRELGGACADDSGCASGRCVRDGCSSGAEGDVCDVDGDCASSRCVGGMCSSGEAGSSCVEDGDCADGLACRDGQCALRQLGDACLDDIDCAAAFGGCFAGACVAQASGELCDSNAECGFNACVDGVCGLTCTDSLSCVVVGFLSGTSQECRAQRCVVVGTLGAPCSNNDECAHDLGGLDCAEGQCRSREGVGCSSGDDCVSGRCEGVVRDRCVTPHGDAGIVCSEPSDCRSGDICRPRLLDECIP